MGETVNPKQVEVSAVDVNWMRGRSVESYSFSEPDLWVVNFTGGGSVSTQSLWRVTTPSGVVVSSSDHGQRFGLTVPVDAAARAMSATCESLVAEVRVHDGAPDLVIRFANGCVLQVLVTSMGYEAWQTTSPSGTCAVVNGSRTASTWTEKRTG